MSLPAPVSGDLERRLGRVLAWEVLEELRAVVREPITLFFSVAMPVGFFALFASLVGARLGGGPPHGEDAATALAAGTQMLATFGTFGVVGVALITPGVSLAEDRTRGWLRVKATSAAPVGVALGAKALAVVPHALGVLAAMTAVGTALGTTAVDLGTWLRLAAVLVLGAMPFALLSLAVGSALSGGAAVAVLQALLIPLAVASGLWFPLEVLPSAVQAVAPALPTYHLAQLALAQLDGSAAGTHVLVLLAWTALCGGVAALALRRVRP